MSSPDVIVVGAGLIGVSIALELGDRGAEVLVLDRGEPGVESSSAAAGMLAASDPETPVLLRALAAESARMFPEYVRKIEGLSEKSADFRRQGGIEITEHSPLPASYRKLTWEELRNIEPSLETEGLPAYFIEEDSVDPALLMQAVLCAAARRRIEIRGHSEVREIRRQNNRAAVTTASEQLDTKTVIDCRGAWSGSPVRPRKGQALYLRPQRQGALEHVLRAPGVYLVPRSAGKIFAGATVEDVGFDKSVEPEIIVQMHRAAARWVPELASAEVISSWAGLRPGTPDNLPLLGPTDVPGVFIASGHFRNGILLAPVTARIIADLASGKPSPIDISAFLPQRFARPRA